MLRRSEGMVGLRCWKVREKSEVIFFATRLYRIALNREKNMKLVAHSAFDQAILTGRSLIETVIDELKCFPMKKKEK